MPPRPPSRPQVPSLFEGLTAVQPYEKLKLETTADQLSMRALDMIAPIGRGQRGLIVAPPRTGKTILLQQIAKAVLANHSEVAVIVLLVDERPEEVTDFKMQIGKQSEIVASSNDNPYRRHIEVPGHTSPSSDHRRSGPRREELLFSEEDMKKIHLLRRALSGTKPQEAMEAMLGRLKLTATNKDFLKGLGA